MAQLALAVCLARLLVAPKCIAVQQQMAAQSALQVQLVVRMAQVPERLRQARLVLVEPVVVQELLARLQQGYLAQLVQLGGLEV